MNNLIDYSKMYKVEEERPVLRYLMDNPKDSRGLSSNLFSEEHREIFEVIQKFSNQNDKMMPGFIETKAKVNDEELMKIYKIKSVQNVGVYLSTLEKAQLIRRAISEGMDWVRQEFTCPDGTFSEAFDDYSLRGIVKMIQEHNNAWLEPFTDGDILFRLPKPYEEWTEEEKKAPPFIIDNWMVSGSFNSIVAAAKAGKTQLAMQMAYCIQNGKEFLGKEVHQADVLYIDMELPQYASASRIERLKKLYDNPNDKVYLIDNIDGETARKLGSGGLIYRIERIRKSYPDIKVVFIDCFYRFFNGDSNDASSVGNCLSVLQAYTRKSGLTINVITHTNKSGLSNLSDLIYAAGGSGVWGQIVDETYCISKPKDTNKGRYVSDLFRITGCGRNFGEQRYLCTRKEETQYFFVMVDKKECFEDDCQDEDGQNLRERFLSAEESELQRRMDDFIGNQESVSTNGTAWKTEFGKITANQYRRLGFHYDGKTHKVYKRT